MQIWRGDQPGNGISFISEHHLQWRKLSNFLESASNKPPKRNFLKGKISAKLNSWQTTLKTQLVVGKHFASPAKELTPYGSASVYLLSFKKSR